MIRARVEIMISAGYPAKTRDFDIAAYPGPVTRGLDNASGDV